MNRDGIGTRLLVFARSVSMLAVIAIGVPTALLFAAQERFGGSSPFAGMPTPSSWSLDRIGGALSDRLTDRTIADIVIRVSLVAAWLAVIVIVLTVAAELAHMVRHDGLSMPDVRGFGVSQRTARVIASGLLVMIPLFTTSANAVARTGPALVPEQRAPITIVDGSAQGRATTAIGPAETGRSSIAPSNRPADAGDYVVRAGDSVFGIAERLAGPDPAAVDSYAEALIDTNLGRRMPDGRTFDNAAFLDVGWVLELPPTPSPPAGDDDGHIEVVERGDTLWSIADEELGDPLRWPELFEANQGRTFDDGATFDDPDLIRPGWDIVMPAAVPVESSVIEVDVVADVPADDGDIGAADVTHVDPHPDARIGEAIVTLVDPHPSVSVDSTRSEVEDVERPVETPSAAVAADLRQDNIWDSAVPGVPVEVAPEAPLVDEVGNAAADAIAVDDAAAQPNVANVGGQVEQRAGSSPTTADPGADAPNERESEVPALLTLGRAAMLSAGVLTLLAVRRRNQLRRARPRSRLPEPAPGAAATERMLRSIDSGERFARVEIATRAVALSLIERDRRVIAVSVSPDGALELRATGPVELRAPWEGADSDWRLPASVPLELLADDARRVGAPCPTLVQLGTDDRGGDVYVDLEALEAVEVGGPGEQADAIVAALAATLAGSVLAEVSTLVGLGVADDAFLGHRNYVPVRDPQRAFEAAADAIGSTASMTRSTFELRALGTSGETWEPAVVLAGAAAGTIQAPSNRTGLALVSASPINGPSSRLAPDGDAWILLPIGLRLTPVGLTPNDLASIAQLVTIGDPEPDRVVSSATRSGDDHTIVDPGDGFLIRFDDVAKHAAPGTGSWVASSDDARPVGDHTVVDPPNDWLPIDDGDDWPPVMHGHDTGDAPAADGDHVLDGVADAGSSFVDDAVPVPSGRDATDSGVSSPGDLTAFGHDDVRDDVLGGGTASGDGNDAALVASGRDAGDSGVSSPRDPTATGHDDVADDVMGGGTASGGGDGAALVASGRDADSGASYPGDYRAPTTIGPVKGDDDVSGDGIAGDHGEAADSSGLLADDEYGHSGTSSAELDVAGDDVSGDGMASDDPGHAGPNRARNSVVPSTGDGEAHTGAPVVDGARLAGDSLGDDVAIEPDGVSANELLARDGADVDAVSPSDPGSPTVSEPVASTAGENARSGTGGIDAPGEARVPGDRAATDGLALDLSESGAGNDVEDLQPLDVDLGAVSVDLSSGRAPNQRDLDDGANGAATGVNDSLAMHQQDRGRDAPSDSGATSPPFELLVRLLGAVEVVDSRGRPVEFERSKTRELVAWLATHRERSTRSAARTAMWELDVRDATFANVVSEARRALARLVEPPPDVEWVGRTNTDALPLHDLVRTDADLIRNALDVARLQPPAQAIATLRPAVELITGMPFAGTSYLWADSEGIMSNLVLLATTATTELAAHCLSIGDIEGVFAATGRGLQVLAGHEELIGLRMEAYARAGDHAGVRQEWESYERVINADPWSDGEPAPKLVELRRRLLNPSR